ncbi:MAG: sulfotransferase family 2 domain-containing protein [Candidatus Thiodiazotropha sp.]
MIINDTHRFVFIHIPKCAGTTVRERLRPYDESLGAFSSRLDRNPELGLIDYVHIPLFILRQHFPTIYEKIRDYDSYTVIRNPISRFPSSFSQHLKMYGKTQIRLMSQRDVRKELNIIMKDLQRHSRDNDYLPYKYIHFQRQSDYIYDQGSAVVKNIFDISDVSALIQQISDRHGIRIINKADDLSQHKANEGLVYKNIFTKTLTEISKMIFRPFISIEVMDKVKNASREFLYTPRDIKLKEVFESREVYDFVEEYYKSDILLYQEITASRSNPNK